MTLVQCDFGDIHVCPGCAHKVLCVSPIVIEPQCTFELAQQLPVTLPVAVGNKWAWVQAGQHERTERVIRVLAGVLGLGLGTWRAHGVSWQDNDLLEFYEAEKRWGHGLIWRAVGMGVTGFTERVNISVPGSACLPLFVPKPMKWSCVRKCLTTHLAVAPEWVVVRREENHITVGTTNAFPLCDRGAVKELWNCVDQLQLSTMRRAGLGRVRCLVAGLRATRALGLTRQSSVQCEQVQALNQHIRKMLPSARYASLAVVAHAQIPMHADLMDRRGLLSFTIARGSCSLWMEDQCGDQEVTHAGRRVMGRVHEAARRWYAFDPRKLHAVLTDRTVQTLVLYTPERAPQQQHVQELYALGFPVRMQVSSGRDTVLRDLWGGAKKNSTPSKGIESEQPKSEYVQALVYMRTCRTGLTDPQLKFIMRGTQGLAARVLGSREPARAKQMVLAIANNLGMAIPKPVAGGAEELGAKPKQQARPKVAKDKAKGKDDEKKEKGNGSKQSEKKVPKITLCEDEWSVAVGSDFNIRTDAVYLTQSFAEAKKWSDVAHNSTAAIGIVTPFPMQLGYKEPSAVQFHMKSPEGLRTPARGFLHHVTTRPVRCSADSQVIELPSLKARSMLVMIDVCKERVEDGTWNALVGHFDGMRNTIPTLLPATARGGLIEVLKTAEWSEKTTTVLVRMTEQAVHCSMKMLGEQGVTVRTPRELQSQFKILWPDRGESDTLSVCQAWAQKFQDHAGVFMKAGRFALRVPVQQVMAAKQACGQQAEEKYVLRGLPLDADASDVDVMLQSVGWAAKANPTSRRVSQGSASFQVLALHPPPKYGFYVKFGYLRCNVQVAQPRALKKKDEEERKKEEKPPRTWAQVLKPAVYQDEPPTAFRWVAPDSRKLKREQQGGRYGEGDHPEMHDELGGWKQAKNKRRKNEPEVFAMSAGGDEGEENRSASARMEWAEQDPEQHDGWQGYEYDRDDQDGEDAAMEAEQDEDEDDDDEDQEEDEQVEESERVPRRSAHIDYAARNRIQIMNTQMEDLTGRMDQMMELLRGIAQNQNQAF
eukprot:4792109-Amphidinium_carterae.2